MGALVPVCLWVAVASLCGAQQSPNFPPIFAVSQDRPVTTSPAQTTCGVQTLGVFCRSSTLAASVTDCSIGYCSQDCPFRSLTPSFVSLLDASRFSPCLTSDAVNVRPGSSGTSFSILFGAGSQCFLNPSAVPSTGTNGSMTLTFWMWMDANSVGTVLDKYVLDDQLTNIFQLQVSPSGLLFSYRTQSGQQLLRISDNIPIQTWSHVALQIFGNQFCYFLNGSDASFSCRAFFTLAAPVLDGPGAIVVGQTKRGIDQFIGRLQDFQFYSETLTNREIVQLYAGSLPPLRILSDCRCPADHPRVKPLQAIVCIRNGVPDNSGDEVLRINANAHPLELINDGDGNSFWLSNPIDEVYIQIDLGDQFQVLNVILQFYSPFPKALTIQKKTSALSLWETWQLYADDCQDAFNLPNNGSLSLPTSVNCIQFSGNNITPYSRGNVTFSILSLTPVMRPGFDNPYNTPDLLQFLRASSVGIRLQGHYYPTTIRHQYYGLYDVVVTGRCNCNGHASSCDVSSLPYRCRCRGDSFTEGNQCERCLPLYNNKPFKAGNQMNLYPCKLCQCYNHSTSCTYNSSFDLFPPQDYENGGGGVCMNCLHNTTGQMCDSCVQNFFRPIGKSLYAADVCQPCSCNLTGVQSNSTGCQQDGGQCLCKVNVAGRACDQCVAGFFNLQAVNPLGCEPCLCNAAGTVNGDLSCDATMGQCNCKPNVRGLHCDQCEYGLYGLNASNPTGCISCSCDPIKSYNPYCDPDTGQCQCKPNVVGLRCLGCASQFFDYNGLCVKCSCNPNGALPGTTCNSTLGQCECKRNVVGFNCDTCRGSFYNLDLTNPVGCSPCECDSRGTVPDGPLCDPISGQCPCKRYATSRTCNQCRPNAYNLSESNAEGCMLCNCDSGGAVNSTCDQNSGQCTCLSSRAGRRCETCVANYFLDASVGGGCRQCDCEPAGTIPGTSCDAVTGQCQCRQGLSGISGIRCDSCLPTFWGMSLATFSCQSCLCDPAGSLSNVCDPRSGQCPCKNFTTGRQCGQCQQGTTGLQADNPYGCSKVPGKQAPPDFVAIGSDFIWLTWTPPDNPNGLLQQYRLYRDEVILASVPPNVTTYNDTDLQPFTKYRYRLEVQNDFGSTSSPTVTLQTSTGRPTGDLLLQVTKSDSRSASFGWTAPTFANGVLQRYLLTSTSSANTTVIKQYEGLDLSATVNGLSPFTNYTFQISVCTSAGCLWGQSIRVITAEAPPAGQSSPNLTTVNSTRILVQWTPPSSPNGIIIFYELWMRGPMPLDNSSAPPTPVMVFRPAGQYNPIAPLDSVLPPPETTFVQGGLQPFTVYEFQVFSENSQGKTSCPWTPGRTAEDVPIAMPTPSVTPVSATSLLLSWPTPNPVLEARGLVLTFTVFVLQYNDISKVPFAPPFTWLVLAVLNPWNISLSVDNLTPFSNRTFVVQLCNSIGCVNSTAVSGQTLLAVPSGLGDPVVSGYNASVMNITWQPPSDPNGPLPFYVVSRSVPALSIPPPSVEVGVYFPGRGYYLFPSDVIPQGVGYTGVILSFRTYQENVLLFFAASPGIQEEIIIVQLREGRPWFIFDTQGCPTAVTTVDDAGFKYNNGYWQSVQANRTRQQGMIRMNNSYSGVNSSFSKTCQSNVFGNNTGIYVGGLPDSFIIQRQDADPAFQIVRQGLQGCLKNFQVMTQPTYEWTSVDFAAVLGSAGVSPLWQGCPSSYVDGVRFLGIGYLVFRTGSFTGGASTEFGFRFRTEDPSGLMFFAYGGTGSFYLVQMVSGFLLWQISRNGVENSIFYNDTTFCDGQWHDVFLVTRGLQMSVTVDSLRQRMSSGDVGQPGVSLASLVYVGGIPAGSEGDAFVDRNGIRSRFQGSFGGCINDSLSYNHAVISMSATAVANLGVDMAGCSQPTADATCRDKLVNKISNDTRNFAYDFGLLPFTEYLYRVEAMNEAGSIASNWTLGRTREGAPNRVPVPAVRVLSSTRLEVTWDSPQSNTGRISRYVVRAYYTGNLATPAIEIFNDAFSQKVLIANATPFTNYTVRLVACTDGGCTETQDGANIQTSEDVPANLSAPVPDSIGTTYIVLRWTYPLRPNGIFTGFILYKSLVPIYTGVLLSFNVTGLSVYTSYDFELEVCNGVGCGTSGSTTITTSQLPPTSVNPPNITLLGPKRVHVVWDAPFQPNGRLNNYVLYLSQDSSTTGDIVYNNTETLIRFCTLDGLSPGTLYFFRVLACTDGGCTLSNATQVTTQEMAPDGVPDPRVTSPSPTQLIVTWEVPSSPNGVILQYHLFHNGLFMFNGSSQRSLTLDNLLPWSLHYFRVEACTSMGCSSSNEISVRTQEAPPQGSIGLKLTIVDPRNVRVQWTSVQTPNGFLTYDVFFEGTFYVNPSKLNFNAYSGRISLYRTNDTFLIGLWINVTGLLPYSIYSVQVNASNTKGFVLSDVVTASMPMAEPDGVLPPSLVSTTSTSITVTWTPVSRWNSNREPTFQLLFKDASFPDAVVENVFPSETTATSYTKTQLQPFTLYAFSVVASNAYGKTFSDWSTLVTRQDKPESIDPPMVTEIEARSLVLSWQPPLRPNGIVNQYNLYQNVTIIRSVDGNVTSVNVTDLVPFTSYVYSIEACTVAGCTASGQSAALMTLSAVPEGVPSPTLIPQSSTSILIIWGPVQSPNGAIMQYNLERRFFNQTKSVLVRTFLPSDPLQYVDDSVDIVPYSGYEYRIAAATVAGFGYGPWATVFTKSARPGGVQSPSVTLLSPTSMRVSWTPPTYPNGVLQSYVVRVPPVSRFDISNVSQSTLVIDNLVPYTAYNVSLTACSDGGCTESLPTAVTTSPSLPDGVQPPLATPISQTYISISWLPPSFPNGANIYYELIRTKLKQPLDANASGFGIWSSIYTGNEMSYEDRGLSIYTTYQYRVTVYNDFGHTTSGVSAPVATFGGRPRKSAAVFATSNNSTSVLVEWTVPKTVDLQGEVSQFLLNVYSVSNSSILGNSSENQTILVQSMTLNSSLTSVVVVDLLPDTVFLFSLTMLMYGGESVTCPPASASTAKGVPDGVQPPTVYSLNDTSVRVSWVAPLRPNGQVTGYFIYVNRLKVDPGLRTPGSYVVTNLRPYTVYDMQIEVCTQYGCTNSSSVQVTTSESLPVGLSAPRVTALSSTAVLIAWSPPLQSNGIVLGYELYRRQASGCGSAQSPSARQGPSKCHYLECGKIEGVCGEQCYSGAKVCCNGILHDAQRDYECCDGDYIPQRNSPSDVCCGGQFYSVRQGYHCCGGRYVEVRSGQICCPDLVQDRVNIGYGDQCCESIPYSLDGSQICCKGVLNDKFSSQCCGGEVISSELVCCGDVISGIAYTRNATKFCCGTGYIDTALSICCTNDIGQSQAYVFDSEIARNISNQKCCGTSSISVSLQCCNGVGYDAAKQICADVSSKESGCGSGMVCSTSLSSSSFCDRCDFDRAQRQCTSYNSLSSKPTALNDSRPKDNATDGMCFTDPLKLYSGNSLVYNDTMLSVYADYRYYIAVMNAAGVTYSPSSGVTTLPALPVSMSAPTYKVDSNQLYTIYLQWRPPLNPNGLILWYAVLRDGVEVFRDSSQLQFPDSNAIVPFQVYHYSVQACNVIGCVSSPTILATTLQGRPEQFAPLILSAVASTTLVVNWSAPARPNGILTNYTVFQLLPQPKVITSALPDMRQYSFVYTGLSPFTLFRIYITVCTEAACTSSSTVDCTTLQDKPFDVSSPRLLVVNASALEIRWSSVSQPNGIILFYLLYRSAGGLKFAVIYNASSDVLSTTDWSVQPGAQYSYILEARTIAGGTNSSETKAVMPMATPAVLPVPFNVSVLSSVSIYVEWNPVNDSENPVDQYSVLLNSGFPSQLQVSVGLDTHCYVQNLLPFTVYRVRIQACLQNTSNGCGTGPSVGVQTFEAPPQGQLPPAAVAQGPYSISLSWLVPEHPNGLITQYRVFRRLGNSSSSGLLVNILNSSVTSFTNSGPDLAPFTEYEYRVVSVNSKGVSTSNWTNVRTFAAPPQVIFPPDISEISAFTMKVNWRPPLASNGIVILYRIQYRAVFSDSMLGPLTNSVTLDGSVLSTSISSLSPYSTYDVCVIVTNAAGSLSSNWTRVLTSQAAPADLELFDIEKMTNGLAVILRWNVPMKPNGIISSYFIYEYGNINVLYQGLDRRFEYTRLRPYSLYRVRLEACTDGGCARSVWQSFYTAEVAPQYQPAPTLFSVNTTSVTLRWTPPLSPSGRILSYSVLRQSYGRIQKRSANDSLIIFTSNATDGTQFQYTDNGVEPFTRYGYSVRTSNMIGSTDSPWQVVETPQAPPKLVSPPKVLLVDGQYSQLLVEWFEPSQPNGIIVSYQLVRNSSVPIGFSADAKKQYLDGGLLAYTIYSYVVIACTGGGCTSSLPTIVQTPETAPLLVSPPIVAALNSTAIYSNWSAPQLTNGKLLNFQLKVNNIVIYSGLDTFFVVTNLIPYRAYSFVLIACTSGGCSSSSAVVGRPDEALPLEVPTPTLHVTSANSIEATWLPPNQPNGIITSYELRRNTTLIQVTTQTQYVDADLQPGTTYSYQVTAYNSKGGTHGPPSYASTFATSPEGVMPPVLEILSPTSIRATWQPPLKPNGIVTGYSLYRGGDVILSQLQQLTAVVPGLVPWTSYSFRVQACTAVGCTTSDPTQVVTPAAPPVDLSAPQLTALVDQSGAAAGVMAQWAPPGRPNGLITRYDLSRRDYLFQTIGELIYSGADQRYADIGVRPYTDYEYMVTAYNLEGLVSSAWQRIRTKEGRPEGVPPPTIRSVTSHSIVLTQSDPAHSNGVIDHYNVFVNNNLSFVSRMSQIELTSLQPFAGYNIFVQVCTSGGCASSPAVTVHTSSDLPQNQTSPTILNFTSTTVDLSWDDPLVPNGKILGFELMMMTGCPFPFADGQDGVMIRCTEGVPNRVADGLVYSAHIDGLIPYMVYQFDLVSYNDAGRVAAPSSTRVVTLPDVPVYRNDHLPTITLNANVLLINWTESFYINAELRSFTLYKNYLTEYIGKDTFYNDRISARNISIVYAVTLTTDYGQAFSPMLLFDPSSSGLVVLTNSSLTQAPSSSPLSLQLSVSPPVYSETWFIVVIVVTAFLLLVALIAVVCAVSTRRCIPYVRERTAVPEKRPHKILKPDDNEEADLHPAYSLPVVATIHPENPEHGDGFSNPAMSDTGSEDSRSISLVDATIERLGKTSLKAGKVEKKRPPRSENLCHADGIRYSHELNRWHNFDNEITFTQSGSSTNGADSGLHSLVYGDIYDNASDRPVSVVKEHLMFPDSHV